MTNIVIDNSTGMKLGMKIIIESDALVIGFGKNAIRVPFDDIQSAEHEAFNETIVKDKSVIGRAVVGGAILGPLGAVVGGMSGIGSKTRTEKGNRLILTYIVNGESITKVYTDRYAWEHHTEEIYKAISERLKPIGGETLRS